MDSARTVNGATCSSRGPENSRVEAKHQSEARDEYDAIARCISRKVLYPVALQSSLLVSNLELNRGMRRGFQDRDVPPCSIMIPPFDEPIMNSVSDSFPTLPFLSLPLTSDAG